MLGLINLYERNEGLSAGRYHEYELDVPLKAVLEVLLETTRFEELANIINRQPMITISSSRISPTTELLLYDLQYEIAPYLASKKLRKRWRVCSFSRLRK